MQRVCRRGRLGLVLKKQLVTMDRSKNRTHLHFVMCGILIFGCQTKDNRGMLFPPMKHDPYSSFFWDKHVKYFTTNNPSGGDTTFFDRNGNMVREVIGGRQTRRWAYDDHHNVVREWSLEERDVENNLYSYELIDSTAIIQKYTSLPTDSWDYNSNDLSRTRASFKIYLLDQKGYVKEEIHSFNNTNVFYAYNDTLLVGEEYLNCGRFEARFSYEYEGGRLKKILLYQENEQKPRRIYYFESGLLDSTQYAEPGEPVRTEVYKYVFY